MNSIEKLQAAIFVAVAFFVPFVLTSAFISELNERDAWRQFRINQNCKAVAFIKGDTFSTFGIASNGHPAVGVGTTPDKTGYLCDDGITYYR